MDHSELLLYPIDAVLIVAAVVAILADRFQKIWASRFAIAGAAMPLLFRLLWARPNWFDWISSIPGGGALLWFCLIYGSGFLFLSAIFLYRRTQPDSRRYVAQVAAAVGMILGFSHSALLYGLLSRME